ncbi:peptide chain release factor N(5)-glutamine methyltransferase [Flavitalea flava]
MEFYQAQQELLSQLRTLYDDREAATIADWVMENSTGLKKIDRLLQKNQPVPAAALESLEKYTTALLTHRPVQYVLQESWFYGMKFYVDENVLIPRPETEELVDWVLEEAASYKLQVTSLKEEQTPPVSILDVGTGSGCIAIALKKVLASSSASSVYACDLSEKALAVAKRNAVTHNTPIHFLQLDFLDKNQWTTLPAVQFLVSNPPYIPLKDKTTMTKGVVDFEPHLALFVEDRDPLVFYQALAGFSREKLLPGGGLFVETHGELAGHVAELFRNAGFTEVTLKKDLQGKDRMIKATG